MIGGNLINSMLLFENLRHGVRANPAFTGENDPAFKPPTGFYQGGCLI